MSSGTQRMTKSSIRGSLAFLAGALTSLMMAIVSLRYYVGISNPYLAYFVSFVVFEFTLILMRYIRGERTPVAASAVAVGMEAALFALGATASFYCMMSIYPPNM